MQVFQTALFIKWRVAGWDPSASIYAAEALSKSISSDWREKTIRVRPEAKSSNSHELNCLAGSFFSILHPPHPPLHRGNECHLPEIWFSCMYYCFSSLLFSSLLFSSLLFSSLLFSSLCVSPYLILCCFLLFLVLSCLVYYLWNILFK